MGAGQRDLVGGVGHWTQPLEGLSHPWPASLAAAWLPGGDQLPTAMSFSCDVLLQLSPDSGRGGGGTGRTVEGEDRTGKREGGGGYI